MANPRIKELPQIELVDGSMIIPIYDYLTDTTYFVLLSDLLPTTSSSNDYRWDSLTTYGVGEIATYGGKIWESQSAGNLDNVPFSGSTFWIEQSQSVGGLAPWVAGVFTDPDTVVVSNITGKYAAYKLKEAVPFISSDFLTELNSHSWELLDEINLNDYSLGPADLAIDCLGGIELRLKKQDINGNRQWSIIHFENLQKITVFVNLTGAGPWDQDMSPIDTIHTILCDSVTYDHATKLWQPIQAGTYRLIFEYDGTNLLMSISNSFG